MSTQKSDAPAPTEIYEWVADNDNFLAHLSWEHWDHEYSICGVELWRASPKKAAGRPRCSTCKDINEGKIEGF